MQDYNNVMNIFDNLDMSAGAILSFGVFALILLIIVGAILITLYILQSIGLYKFATKHNIANAWLAWLPVGNMYILGKLGFEIYAKDENKNEVFTWILLGCSAVELVFNSNGLGSIAALGTIVFSTWAYYNIFNKECKQNCILFTVLQAIFRIGGIILFAIRNKITGVVSAETNEVKKEETNKEEVKKEKETKEKYCSTCGNKVNKDSKFCPKCGGKL